jgi:hypothetical protein
VKSLALTRLISCSLSCAPGVSADTRPGGQVSIAEADPDFSLVLFPDTQYYSGPADIRSTALGMSAGVAEPRRLPHGERNGSRRSQR